MDSIIKDDVVRMKCITCGYEEEDMPARCFDEDSNPPHILCPRCNFETLYQKKILLYLNSLHLRFF